MIGCRPRHLKALPARGAWPAPGMTTIVTRLPNSSSTCCMADSRLERILACLQVQYGYSCRPDHQSDCFVASVARQALALHDVGIATPRSHTLAPWHGREEGELQGSQPFRIGVRIVSALQVRYSSPSSRWIRCSRRPRRSPRRRKSSSG